ncbi:PQQ-dependent sugar dehydrogenase [Chryseobacterium herbae]|uniref:PQQ-dependent sugar dehydrogenase n=1 Tax=Chryseobacterium herbae TaxID=2976476 RepID=A0ABT2IYQ6_9FLAO|nr:PQQ-dependent sugar dehydrogenase [Chryseobacterium sp. pc1-10]MCT2563984.1 PQQ-dependent sugar dehydrogenase [Chryseobacterium sp. pc1-10]
MMIKIYTLAIAVFINVQLFAQANDYSVREVKSGLYIPWEMVSAPDGTIWFTQRHGSISRLNPVTGAIKQLIFEQNVSINNGEGGMLGLALHPDFPNTPEVFCSYNYLANGNDYREKLVVYEYNATTDALTYKRLIVDFIDAAVIHNGSRLLINNNMLYMTTGDAADQSLPQNTSSLNGKILRYNLDGTIPSDNPIPGSAVWSYGHRNPQGLTMMGTKLVSSEHGPSNDDEINIIEAGRNYGWPNVEGYCNLPAEITFCNANNVYEPAKSWTPTIAVCGIDFYTHSLFPQWQNKLLLASLKNQAIYVLTFDANQNTIISEVDIPQVSFGRIRDVLAAPNGKIYVSTSNSNSVNNKIDKIYEIYDPTPNNLDTDETPNLKNNWTASPVPANNTITIQNKSNRGIAEIDLVDMSGKLIKQLHSQGKQMQIDITGLAAGFYYLKIKENGSVSQILKIQKL